jgi:hypothetical protein
MLQDAVAGLAGQVNMLKGEMRVFQLLEGPSSEASGRRPNPAASRCRSQLAHP